MAEAFVNVTEGSGKKLHTFNRTIGANSVEDEVVLAGIPYLATYALALTAVSVATGGSHVCQIMAGASLNVYLHKIVLYQSANATAAAYMEWSVRKLTSAGTGGGVPTFVATDTTDAGAGATAMTLPTAKGTETTVPYRAQAYFIQTPGAATGSQLRVLELDSGTSQAYKPLWRIPAGTANGIAIRNDTGIAGATVGGYVIITEANF